MKGSIDSWWLRIGLLGAAFAGPAASPGQSTPPAQPVDASASAEQQPAPEISVLPARLSDVEGSVRIAELPPQTEAATPGQVPPPPPELIFTQAAINMPVEAGMQVETGDGGRAEIQFNDGAVARLAPNSALAVISLGNSGEELRAVRGLTYYELPDGNRSNLVLLAGPDQLTMPSGALLRADLDSDPYGIAVLRGSAHVSSTGEVGFEVPAGETATLDPVSPTAYDLKPEVASDSWDGWNADRDAALASLATGETNARFSNGDVNAQAWNDLDYYGSWYDVPGAGLGWAPDGVDASFDPYGSGAWGFYPGVGPTWISAYPWGWLPYHCGGWTFAGGFGWIWQPRGGCGFGWYPYAGVRNPPPGYVLPARPLRPRRRAQTAQAPAGLLPVARGPAVQFRAPGTPRLTPRPFPLRKADEDGVGPALAAALPVMSPGRLAELRQPLGYAPGVGASQFGASGRPVYMSPLRGISPPPRAVPPSVRYVPPPSVPAPRSAPAPAAPVARHH